MGYTRQVAEVGNWVITLNSFIELKDLCFFKYVIKVIECGIL